MGRRWRERQVGCRAGWALFGIGWWRRSGCRSRRLSRARRRGGDVPADPGALPEPGVRACRRAERRHRHPSDLASRRPIEAAVRACHDLPRMVAARLRRATQVSRWPARSTDGRRATAPGRCRRLRHRCSPLRSCQGAGRPTGGPSRRLTGSRSSGAGS